MGTMIGILFGVIAVMQGGQIYNHPELVEHFKPAQYEAYEPSAGPDCDADSYAVRSDCSR